jgi:chitinase
VLHRIPSPALSRFFLLLLLIFCSVSASRNAAAQTQAQQEGPLLVGYFPQWGLLAQPQYLVKNLETTGGATMLNQVNYSQGAITAGHCSIAKPDADLNYTFTAENSVDGTADAPDENSRATFRGNFHQLEELKERNPRLKILISLEGSDPIIR